MRFRYPKFLFLPHNVVQQGELQLQDLLPSYHMHSLTKVLTINHFTGLRRLASVAMLICEAPARLRDFALCWKKHSLASTGFLEHLKTPTDGALLTQCLPSPSHYII